MKKSIFTYLLLSLVIVGLLGVGVLASSNRDVEIGEIAWAGTKASWADEWIELRNLTDKKVDLSGWKIIWEDAEVNLGKEAKSTIEVRQSTLGPGEILLLERTDDKTVSTVKADIIYKGSLDNSGEKVVLENDLGEKIQVIDASESWPAGSGSDGEPAYAAMELVGEKWKGQKTGGESKDADGNKIYGTPGKREQKSN